MCRSGKKRPAESERGYLRPIQPDRSTICPGLYFWKKRWKARIITCETSYKKFLQADVTLSRATMHFATLLGVIWQIWERSTGRKDSLRQRGWLLTDS